jgi:hypothetical protein
VGCARESFLDTGNQQHVEIVPRRIPDMAFGRRMAAVNRRITNRVTGPLAPRLPGFGVIVHAGRTSGRMYRTPVNVFRVPGGYLVALTYGTNSEWVRNVVAAGGCDRDAWAPRAPGSSGALPRREAKPRRPPGPADSPPSARRRLLETDDRPRIGSLAIGGIAGMPARSRQGTFRYLGVGHDPLPRGSTSGDSEDDLL